MLTVTFLMEQHIGHRTFYENLRRFIEPTPQIAARWVEVSYFQPGGLWERLTILPQNVRGTLRGRAQVRAGLRAPADLLVYNTQVPAALAGRMGRQRPYILCTDITPRQYDDMARHYNHTPDRGGLLTAYKHRVNRRLFQGAARVLPWSTWTRASLLQDYGVALDKIETLPPGVDTALWQPGHKKAGGAAHILFVGGDLYRKGGHLLLQAFAALPPGAASLHLVTRTAVPPAANIRTYPGLRPNDAALIALYQSCDIFALPTEAEAFGIAAMEASAVGLPVIATRVGGLTDVVADGETGYLLPPGDLRGLIHAFERLIADPALRQRLGQAARARALSRFDARKNAARLVEIMKNEG
ncbi:MAG: glycosyltransferase family 4 protein [Ardenticatenaceae bacterium]|nr:glycosyltransferase family 4 protein [Ardenticatenaceae bacterium]